MSPLRAASRDAPFVARVTPALTCHGRHEATAAQELDDGGDGFVLTTTGRFMTLLACFVLGGVLFLLSQSVRKKVIFNIQCPMLCFGGSALCLLGGPVKHCFRSGGSKQKAKFNI